MAKRDHEAAVFVLLGQSNATGHALPMEEQDKITRPLKNVFGLSRAQNQSYDNEKLVWSGYESGGMNLAEEQDHTYSVSNCLAARWQAAVDGGADLPDMYIVHISIGAQGVSKKMMWYPDREKEMTHGPLGSVRISLHPFTLHILSLVRESLQERGLDMGTPVIHWRGGEQEICVPMEEMEDLLEIYRRMFREYRAALGTEAPVILHAIACDDVTFAGTEPGETRRRQQYVNDVFAALCREEKGFSIFDPRECPLYDPALPGRGIFKSDNVHFTPQVNGWVAEQILRAAE